MSADDGYADKKAWESRYRECVPLQLTAFFLSWLTALPCSRNGDLFEWYAPFEYLSDTLTFPEMDNKTKVLVMGCGTSGAAKEFYPFFR